MTDVRQKSLEWTQPAMISAWLLTFLAVSGVTTLKASEPAWLPSSYYPAWRTAIPLEVLSIEHNPALDDNANGNLLEDAIESLTAGQRLEIGPGRYVIDSKLSMDLDGTAAHPIWIVAADMADKPVITRSNENQNTINIGDSSPAAFLIVQGLEVTGGSDLIKIRYASNIWIDQCYLHDGGGVGIAANSANTDHLFITRNEIKSPGQPGNVGEGLYLGGNNGSVIMSYSIVALNHIYDTLDADQGDGIEVKQGSHHNWIVENWVHDTNYPCILVYGTDGNAVNVIERNIVYKSNDNTMQIQGEAIVRNNLIMAGSYAFYSRDHQGNSRDLRVVHNTIINEDGQGARLIDWTNRPGMVFANNVVYSRYSDSIHIDGGDSGIAISGNVVYGNVDGASGGYVLGIGLPDFVDVTWDATSRDARPTDTSAILGQGDVAFGEPIDLLGLTRILPLESGAFDFGPDGLIFADGFESGDTTNWIMSPP